MGRGLSWSRSILVRKKHWSIEVQLICTVFVHRFLEQILEHTATTATRTTIQECIYCEEIWWYPLLHCCKNLCGVHSGCIIKMIQLGNHDISSHPVSIHLRGPPFFSQVTPGPSKPVCHNFAFELSARLAVLYKKKKSAQFDEVYSTRSSKCVEKNITTFKIYTIERVSFFVCWRNCSKVRGLTSIASATWMLSDVPELEPPLQKIIGTLENCFKMFQSFLEQTQMKYG